LIIICSSLPANIGGTLGLCIGFSLVSGFEIVFFFCLRWIFESSDIEKLDDDNDKPNREA
jgi:hypothetical protein